MLKIIVEKWDRNKDKLREIFKTQKNTCSFGYKDLVKTVFGVIYNETDKDEYNYYNRERLDIDRITEIDDGEYQGTLLYFIPFEVYQPSECDYLMTYADYGSCNCCDTLQRILADFDYGEYGEPLNARQIKAFMQLSKDILQNTIKPYNFGWRYDEKFEIVEVKDVV